MDDYRVVVYGGRDFYDEHWLKKELCDLVWQRHRFKDVPKQIRTLIHGGAPGVDRMAGSFGIGCGLDVKEYRADWNKHGRAAGPIRNQQMIDEGRPDLGVEFPGGRGTADMTRRLRAAGIPVIEVRADGQPMPPAGPAAESDR